MTPERWARIQELFHQALEQGKKAHAWLEATCEDEALRGEVLTLLAAHEQVDDSLERAVGDAFALATEEDNEPERQHIGPYRVLRELGRGGLSTVYLAERDDDEFHRQVAIKVVKRGMDTRDILSRLRRERQILATLDHPYIARLFDGGSTEDGLPYFVMEAIDGDPIDAWCDAQRLPIKARLELFRKVCTAVQYAHQNLVVHRDIKPGNLLVTADGTPKLLDFGIAKLLDHRDGVGGVGVVGNGIGGDGVVGDGVVGDGVVGDGIGNGNIGGGNIGGGNIGGGNISGGSISGGNIGGGNIGGGNAYTATAAGLRLLTPNYASPEQIRGEPLTTATDIYSLGVLLYQLLTGRPPYELPGSTAAMERVVCEEIPQRPSVAVQNPEEEREARSLARAGRPERIARMLRGDLDNITLMALRKEPQRRYASAQQFADDLRRYLQAMPVLARRDTFRYRAGKFIRRNRLAVLAVALVFLSLTAGMVATTWQARLAEAERVRAEKNLELAERQRAKAERVSTFLSDLFEQNDPGESKGDQVTAREILDQGAERIALDLKKEPELQADMMDVMGTVYQKLGLYTEAQSLLEQALELRHDMHGPQHTDVASSLRNLAFLHLTRNELEEAEDLYQQALRLRRTLEPQDDVALAEILNDLAVLRYSQQNFEAAERLFKDALELRRNVLPPDDPEIGETLHNLAALFMVSGDMEAAEEPMRQGLKIRRLNYGDLHPLVADSLNNLSVLVYYRNRPVEAEALTREVVEMRRKLLGPKHPDLAISLNNLAESLRAQGKLEEAEPIYREALSITREALGESNFNVSQIQLNLAFLHHKQGNLDQAETFYQESLTLRRELLGAEHQRTSYSLAGLGLIELDRGRLKKAESLLRDALHLHGTLSDPEFLADSRGGLGAALLEQGRFDEAEPLLLEALKIIEANPQLDDDLSEARNRLTRLYEVWGRPQEASKFRETVP